MEINAVNVNHAFRDVWWNLRTDGVKEDSRNGPVLVMDEPTITIYHNPVERVLFSPLRDANHVFHLVEAIWMLAGRDDVAPLLPYNSNYSNYAECDGRVHGAYGHRWRQSFGMDQIYQIVHELRENPNSRRAVMAMWDPFRADLGAWKDTPCNTHIYFDARGGELNMTVCCRSNDILWGAYGANVVHFSMLQELIAWELGLPVGVYRQFSNNFHAYMENPTVKKLLEDPPYETFDLYQRGAKVIPMLFGAEDMDDFLTDCENFFETGALKTQFMRTVVAPLAGAYQARKAGDLKAYNDYLGYTADCDWKLGFQEWVARRNEKKEQA